MVRRNPDYKVDSNQELFSIGLSNMIGSIALHALKELTDEYNSRDIDVIFAGLKGPVRDLFKRSRLENIIGPEQFHLNINRAVESLEDEQEEPSHLANDQ